MDVSNACSYALCMATFFEGLPDDEGWRLDHWREGASSAHIVWRDGQGVEHERTLTDEAAALLALTWVRGHRAKQETRASTSARPPLRRSPR